MKKFKSHFKFSKQERSGIFFLLLIIVFLQVCFFIFKYTFKNEESSLVLDEETQAKIDSLKQELAIRDSITIYPFNPNFISDYKGYTLGMSVKEIDRLHAFRSDGKFINSALEFQMVTKISDSLLKLISPNFKFPSWVSNKNKDSETGRSLFQNKSQFETTIKNFEIKEINSVTAEELQTVSGIGDKLSNRIIKFRDRLGGFMVNEQLYDVYGLEPVVVKRALERFKVLSEPSISKIDINTASAQEISKLIYLRYELASKIVEYRQVNGVFASFEELNNIEGFPTDKINRIQLYLSL
ncbi:ComEA family DNA-binding protein [Maribacter sp. HTCC2170]|uniref:ComEA family DNA-binding protein n=1 Tax=Maribacter sp. (strain HTCC2170 / KCCM 42371) TaxID=313603 RepID=UPI00006B1A89|nr:helix-hairpin-helix domain-containing protein [Maribacter sp. HTCC2170]EAR00651.1 hypothetical protein FB2170_16241 [Maribacter sp. HTCC2170]